MYSQQALALLSESLFTGVKRLLVMVIILLGASSIISAQKYPFRNYSIQDGLSESVVNAIIQDSQGYIWVGTGYGLNRFDGNSFRNYFEESGLNHPKIHSLYESENGWIWIGTSQGVNVLKADSIWTVDELSDLEDVAVMSILESSDGSYWFGTEGKGLWRLDSDKKIHSLSKADGLPGNEIRDIVEMADGSIWIATRSGLGRIEGQEIEVYTTEQGLPENRIRDLHIGNDSTIWIATRAGLSHWTGESFETLNRSNGLIGDRVQIITESADHTLWIGTESGISALTPGGFTNYSVNEGLANNIIHSSMIDREGNIWFGTFGGGLSLFLGSFLENYDTEEGLSNNLVTSVTEDPDGNLWIATYGGGLMKKTANGFQYLAAEQGLPDDRVYHISTDSNGLLWIGMRDGLSYLKNGKLVNIPDEDFPFRKVRHVLKSRDGSHWISTYENGLIRFDGSSYERYGTEDGLPSNTILGAVEDDEGALWVATYSGVVRMFEDTITTYSIQEGIPNNGVMTIMKDQSGTIWISTFGGIAWFDGVRFVEITEQDGLPGKVCYFLTQDKSGAFWVGTNSGVARLDVDQFYSTDRAEQQKAIQILNTEQGLISEEMNLGAVYMDEKGHLWMGSVEGVSHLNTDKYSGNLVPPLVHIERFSASGTDVANGGISLPHTNNFVEFQFTGLNFTAPAQVLYEYRIEGIDPDWQTTTSRSVRYPSLPPGEYTFQVHARNASGIWSDKTASISFEILPPFWMTWWFICFIGMIVAGIIYLFYRNYKTMKMVDIERMRVRIASDLHDDVGASLTEIALQSDFIQAIDMKPELKQSLLQIGKQCRHVVTSLDDIVWSIDARNDTLGDLTDRMQDYVINVLAPKNFEINYAFDNLNMDNKLPVTVKENLYLIFKEAINNISKYSNGDKVDIRMTNNGGTYTLLIHDNGTTGKGTKKTGHGLRNMEMRAQRIGGNFDFDDEDGFTVRLQGNLN